MIQHHRPSRRQGSSWALALGALLLLLTGAGAAFGSDSKSIDRLVEKGHQLLQEERTAKAVRVFRRAHRVADGQSFDAARGLAAALRTRDPRRHLDEALEIARTLPGLAATEVESAQAANLLGTVLYEQAYLNQRDVALFRESEEAFVQGLEGDPDSASMHLGLALARLQQLIWHQLSGDDSASFEPVLEGLRHARTLGLRPAQDQLAARGQCIASWHTRPDGDRLLRYGDLRRDPALASVVDRPRWAEQPPVAMTDAARRARLDDWIGLQVVIDAEGQPQCLWLVKGSTHGMDARVLETVGSWRFEPARLEGQPIAVAWSMTVAFQLD